MNLRRETGVMSQERIVVVEAPRTPLGEFGGAPQEALGLTTDERTARGRTQSEMAEFGMPPNYVPSLQEILTDDVFIHAEQAPEQVGFSRRVDGRWVPVTYRELAEQVTRLAAGLIASGIQPGDRVALCSHTRFEWMLCDFAIWTAAAVTVPIYETSSAEQVEWILSDSEAVAAFVETRDHAKTVARAQV